MKIYKTIDGVVPDLDSTVWEIQFKLKRWRVYARKYAKQ